MHRRCATYVEHAKWWGCWGGGPFPEESHFSSLWALAALVGAGLPCYDGGGADRADGDGAARY